MSGNITTGYNSEVVTGFKSDAVFANIHSDTYTTTNEIGIQGPFTETWVGGLQARHVRVNRFDSAATTRATWQQIVYGEKATGTYAITDFTLVQDGDTFRIGDGTTLQTFEFDRDWETY